MLRSPPFRRTHTGLAAMLLAAALAIAPARAAAQEIRGIVRDSLSGAPIAAAVVMVVDSTGRVLVRNLSDDQGRYHVLRADGARRLQVLRIGFRPRTLDLPAPVAGTTPLDVAMASIPHLLEAVEVRDQPNCPDRKDRRAALALWEQARAGLLATVVAREANPAFVYTARFDRTLDRGGKPDGQVVRLDSGYSSRPFVSARTAADFVANGFLVRGNTDRVFYAPDADVLLDDAFSRGYCFEIADGDRAHPRQLGLAFEPATHARDRIDVAGTLWIDSVGPALTTLEFRYVGLSPAENDLKAGGHIEFRTMPNSVPLIDRWWLRLVGVRSYLGGAGATHEQQILEVHEIGGEILTARWPHGASWSGALGTVRGHLVANAGGVAGATVRLRGSDYAGVTDSSGAFEIAHVLPGPYELSVDEPRLAALGIDLTRHQRVMVERDSVAQVTMRFPALGAVIDDRCADVRGPGPATLIAGRVRNADGSPAGRVAISLWRAPTPLTTTASDTAMRFRSRVTGADQLINHGVTRDDGTFSVCRVPTDAHLIVELTRDDAVASTVVVTEPADQRLWVVDMIVP